jgi:hypothetical protein
MSKMSLLPRRLFFIHLTAGDAGLGIDTRGKKHPFYLAREIGAETAIGFRADADGIRSPNPRVKCDSAHIQLLA